MLVPPSSLLPLRSEGQRKGRDNLESSYIYINLLSGASAVVEAAASSVLDVTIVISALVLGSTFCIVAAL